MINLPIDFLNKMEQLLQDDYPAFLESYSRPSKKGVRLNPLKCTWDILEKIYLLHYHRPLFSPLSYYIEEEEAKVGILPLHHAGSIFILKNLPLLPL